MKRFLVGSFMRVALVFYAMVFLGFVPVLAQPHSAEYSCHAADDLYPLLGRVEALTEALSIESRRAESEALTLRTYPVRRYQNLSGSAQIWDAGKVLLAVGTKASSFGNYYNGSLEFHGPQSETISLWCSKLSR